MNDLTRLLNDLAAAPVLDEPVLREITGAAGMTPLELVDMFVDDFNANLTLMRDALPATNREVFNRSAHSLKSSAGNVGAQRLAMLAAALEKGTKYELDPDISVLVNQLETAFTDFCHHIETHRVPLSVG
ncbi:MAG: Hpt domain-containing protein [Rhodocyclaceae bacterium]|nr:Hpt domain-containing protein [Rhodocyclaceae bacterium]MBK6907148.1 Hpt domain-containing protein [Rhodocyclaceae bacterium]